MSRGATTLLIVGVAFCLLMAFITWIISLF